MVKCIVDLFLPFGLERHCNLGGGTGPGRDEQGLCAWALQGGGSGLGWGETQVPRLVKKTLVRGLSLIGVDFDSRHFSHSCL